MPKILAVFGTRPEAIKMAPVILALKNHEAFNCRVVVTAQHREMLDQVLDIFGLQPDWDLGIMRPRQTLEEITVRALEGLLEVYEQEGPDLILVHGDTTTTFVAALAAFYRRMPVGHVEAGLRTRVKYAPYPEEMNRRLTGALADLHFAPTELARKNLLQEGVRPEAIFVTGNTVIDALYATVDPEFSFEGTELAGVDFAKRVILITAHRRENLGEPLREIFLAVRDIVTMFDDVEVIFPVHKNPLVRQEAAGVLGGVKRVHLVEPLNYRLFVNVMLRSYVVLTDSGGLQEEAPSLGKPVLVLREVTERPEALAAGTVKLVGTDRDTIAAETAKLLRDVEAYRSMAEAVNPYGDGRASVRILKALMFYFGLTREYPEEFIPRRKTIGYGRRILTGQGE